MRWLLVTLAALVLIITSTSAWIRLSQSGIGCADWPACYGPVVLQQRVVPDADDPLLVPRALHRVTASLAGVLVIVVVALGWRRWCSERKRIAAIGLLVTTIALAWIGTVTPSPLPIVTLANLAGGFALLAFTVRLLPSRAPTSPACGSRVAVGSVLVLALLASIATGGMLVARHAATTCNTLPACEEAVRWSLAALDPMQPTAGASGLAALHIVHRLLAVIVTILAMGTAAWAWRVGRIGAIGAGTVGVLVAAQAGTGAWMTLSPGMLPAILHNLGAAALFATAALIAARMMSRPVESLP